MSNLLPDIALTFMIGRCKTPRFAASELKSEIEASNQRQGGAMMAPARKLGVVSGCIIFKFQLTQNFFDIATMNVHDDYLLGT